jgi:ribosomal protein S18 acetylase RimI-like enzyme
MMESSVPAGVSGNFHIARMDQNEVPAVIDVHLRSFPGFFLTFLGSAFLRELYLATIEDLSGIGFVAKDGTWILGFVTGTAQPAGFYRRLLQKRWWRFGLAAVRPALKQPSIIPRLLRAFSMPTQAAQQGKHGTLMSLAVHPDAQDRGIGQSLVTAFLREASQRGLEQVDLTTDRDNNDSVNRFYERLGFVCARSFTTPEGRAMNDYLIDLATWDGREKWAKSGY